MPLTDLLRRRDEALGRYVNERATPESAPPSAVLRREETRPFSLLAWYDLSGHSPESIVVKVTRRGTPASAGRRPRESVLAERVRALLGPAAKGIVVPLRDYADLDTTITSAVPGQQLAQLIETRCRWWPSTASIADVTYACEAAGKWLRLLHDARPSHATWSPAQLREDLDNRMRRLLALPRPVGMPGSVRARALDWVDARLASAGESDLAGGLTHGDFSPSNMLIAQDDIHVLDFTMVRDAPHLLDVTRFCHQVDLLGVKPVFRPSTRAALQQAFLRGYGRPALLARPVVDVFLLRHTLTHWLGRARRVEAPMRRLPTPAFWLCLHHRRRLSALLGGAPLPWESTGR